MFYERDFYKKVVEAVLFVAGRSVSLKELSQVCDNLSKEEILSILQELKEEYQARGVRLVEVAEGYRLESAPEVADYLKTFLKPKGFRWTKTLLETLAVIAYFQPITRAEISAKRGGVDVGAALKTLLENNFIRVVGRKDVPGRPLLYGTTPFFLEYFGLKSLKDLPPLDELKSLAERED
ncbi:SMC-Scp complex subunit ScpB [Thermodesulfobacterium sp.]|jgi:segregation and condensation protein B|uniref:SMC-Scp complex subunit ScpB n=1 Tax=Thermodesulfobacterium sp. TaxID=1965289 RepID=UPI0025807EBE|nr:SMC-Scp complex subunit ScpB [Thermodesulfobacterium sp.]MBZ4680959.1 hypothetical protein [Thermodesulfobacterium sp.]